jgi:hypothetical protein
MQLALESFARADVIVVNIAVPLSLSDSATEPAATEFPEFATAAE